MNDSELLSLVRKHIPAAYRMVTLTRWKDGIDLDEPVFGLHSLVADILAAERAAVVAECAKAMDDMAREWSDYKDRMPTSATAEHNYVQGRINAFTEAAAAIRKLGEKRE